MYCYNCGKKIRDDSNFCYSCGAKIDAEKAEKETNKVSKTSKAKDNEKKCWSVFAKIGCLMSIGAFFLFSFLTDDYMEEEILSYINIIFNISLTFSILGCFSKEKEKTARIGVALSIIGIVLTIIGYTEGF